MLNNKISNIWKESISQINTFLEPILNKDTINHSAPSIIPGKTNTASTIAPGLKISGTLFSETKLNIMGEIEGDVVCLNDIKICGKVTGDITGQNISLQDSIICGNIKAVKSLTMHNCTIMGDIWAQDAEINSMVNGDIDVAERLVIGPDSVIQGGITAATLAIEAKAKLEGPVTVKQQE